MTVRSSGGYLKSKMTLRELLHYNLRLLSTRDLLLKHAVCHALYHVMKRKKIREIGHLTLKELKKIHDRIVAEMRRRGIRHHYRDRLDRAAVMPRKFLPFRVKHPFVVLVGSATYGTPHDVDFIIATHDLRGAIEQKTMNALKKWLPDLPLHFATSFYCTPFSPYVPLYALLLLPKRVMITRKFAPMYGKPGREDRIHLKVDWKQIVRRLPNLILLWKDFVWFSAPSFTFFIPKLPAVHFVPLYERLIRMFPTKVQPRVRVICTDEPKGVPVYDLCLEKLPAHKVEM